MNSNVVAKVSCNSSNSTRVSGKSMGTLMENASLGTSQHTLPGTSRSSPQSKSQYGWGPVFVNLNSKLMALIHWWRPMEAQLLYTNIRWLLVRQGLELWIVRRYGILEWRMIREILNYIFRSLLFCKISLILWSLIVEKGILHYDTNQEPPCEAHEVHTTVIRGCFRIHAPPFPSLFMSFVYINLSLEYIWHYG